MAFLPLFSYTGPLSNTELRKADEAGFVQSIGSGRLSHVRNWPKEYADWADGDPKNIAKQKHSTITDLSGAKSTLRRAEFKECLMNNWPKGLHRPIMDLIWAAFSLFRNSALYTAAK